MQQSTDSKKIAAAAAAVMRYIDEIAVNFSSENIPAPERKQTNETGPWRLEGRRAQMQVRDLMQMRALRR